MFPVPGLERLGEQEDSVRDRGLRLVVKCQCSFCCSEKVNPNPSSAPQSKAQSLSLATWQAKSQGQRPKLRVARLVGARCSPAHCSLLTAGNLGRIHLPIPELSILRGSLIETGGLGDGHDDMLITEWFWRKTIPKSSELQSRG